jgi:hypothetical protein
VIVEFTANHFPSRLTGKEWKRVGAEGHDGDPGSVEATLLIGQLQGFFHGEDRMKLGRAGIILVSRTR